MVAMTANMRNIYWILIVYRRRKKNELVDRMPDLQVDFSHF